MALPAALVVVLLVVQAGVLGADVVAAQGLARDAARTAAVGDAADVAALVDDAAGAREVEVELEPSRPQAGEPVTVSLRLRSRAFGNLGRSVWLPARATMRAEAP